MKQIIKNLMYTGLFSLALIFNSCQEEFEEIIDVNNQETITANSTTANLIINTSANDGSFDNIVDGASCISINFPYTVEIGGVQITIDSREDLNLIEQIFDEFENDDDILELIFPIVITLEDFTEITIGNIEDLRELIAECNEGADDDDIECIDFVYPITLFTFNLDRQQTGSFVINSDMELRRFFANLEDDDIISVDFPIALEKFDGTEIVVTNNAELARALEFAKNECDEDDDNDFNDDDFSLERLDALLIECPWLVRDIRRDGTDQTDQFFDYLMNFTEDGEVVVRDREGNMLTGTWGTSITDRGVLLDLEFDVLASFSLQWLVYDIGDGRIKLFGDDNNRIILKQSCDDNGSTECNPAVVAEYLESGCVWQIADTDLDIDFDGTIDFSNRNIHAFLNNGAFADEGNWEVTDQGLRFNNLIDRIGLLAGDWIIVECSETRIKLENSNGRFVVLEKNCDIDVPTLDSLRSILRECEWVIRSVRAEGVEIDRLLGYEFSFLPDGVVTLSNGVVTSEGTWEVGLNDDEIPSLLISIGDESGVNFDWPLRDLLNDRLRFEVEEIGYSLVLQRVCDDNASDSDVPEIRNILLGGQWIITTFEVNGDNMIAAYDGFDFNFSNMNQVEVSVNDDLVSLGLWRVLRNADDNLKLFLNFSDPGNNFAPLTAAYYIQEFTSDNIVLVFESEIETKVLVFERR